MLSEEGFVGEIFFGVVGKYMLEGKEFYWLFDIEKF